MLLRQIVAAQGVRGRGQSVRVMVAGGLQRGPSRGEQYLVRFARCSRRRRYGQTKVPGSLAAQYNLLSTSSDQARPLIAKPG